MNLMLHHDSCLSFCPMQKSPCDKQTLAFLAPAAHCFQPSIQGIFALSTDAYNFDVEDENTGKSPRTCVRQNFLGPPVHYDKPGLMLSKGFLIDACQEKPCNQQLMDKLPRHQLQISGNLQYITCNPSTGALCCLAVINNACKF